MSSFRDIIINYIEINNIGVFVEEYDEDLYKIIVDLLKNNKIPIKYNHDNSYNVINDPLLNIIDYNSKDMAIIHFYSAIYYFVNKKYNMVMKCLYLSINNGYWQAHDLLSDILSKGTIVLYNDVFIKPTKIYEIDYNAALIHKIKAYELKQKIGIRIDIGTIITDTNVSWVPQFNKYFMYIFKQRVFLLNTRCKKLIKKQFKNIKINFIISMELILLIFKHKKFTKYISYSIIKALYDNIRKSIVNYTLECNSKFLKMYSK